ncbi:MAG: STM4012 family radical SAM protein [Aureliella sp.]
MSSAVLNQLQASPFTAYTYAYPHKTAYRRLDPAVPLESVWQDEPHDHIFLYLHIPFCEYRCGFCNLFTLAQPERDVPGQYLDKLQQQARAFRDAIPEARFSRLAIGGGTPTYLSCDELQRLMAIVTDVLGAEPQRIPISCEASPATIDRDKLSLLRDWGVDRLSLGVQSFSDEETRMIGRPQRAAQVDRALDLLSQFDFPVRNLDLIYGGEEQTVASWMQSVQRAIDFGAEELFLYPLYVRRLTGLGKRSGSETLSPEEQNEWDAFRLDAYQAARELLLASGYRQVSLRNFRRDEQVAVHERSADSSDGAVYCCQLDGMVGLGCGARSYTRTLHYSNEYAVGSSGVRNILRSYLARSDSDFRQVDYGFHLDDDEQRRRYLLMSLLQVAGIDRAGYRQRFGSDALDDFPQLAELAAAGLASIGDECIALTEDGLALSDAIGPWFYSARVQRLSEGYQWN